LTRTALIIRCIGIMASAAVMVRCWLADIQLRWARAARYLQNNWDEISANSEVGMDSLGI
jgi:hypothetical protein